MRAYDGFEILAVGTQEPLKELKAGMEVLAPSLFGYVKATVMVDKYGQTYGETESTHFPFFRTTDERDCWVCNCAYNKRSIARLDLPA